MTSEVDSFNDFTIPRVAQLTQRSNQFNLRTIRYTDNDIRQISGSDDYLTLSFTLDDKFGSHGLTALVILKKERQDTLFIDTWIMSCRILKRGMEDFTLNHLVQLARYHSIDYLKGEYIPTAKNGIVKDHYSALGFEYDGKYWTLNCSNYTNRKTFIKNSKHGVESNIAGS
jgi:FkbH-like protein